MEGEELETTLLAASDVAGIITALAKNVCDGGADRRIVFIKKGDGNVVAAAGRNVALQENQERDYTEVQEAIEYMNAKQSRLLAAMERKQTLRSGASDEILRKVLHDVLVLDGKISEVEEKLLDASEEMRTLRVERRKMEVEERRVSDLAGVSVWTQRRYLELQVRKANLDLLDVEKKGAQVSTGSMLIKGLRLEIKVL